MLSKLSDTLDENETEFTTTLTKNVTATTFLAGTDTVLSPSLAIRKRG